MYKPVVRGWTMDNDGNGYFIRIYSFDSLRTLKIIRLDTHDRDLASKLFDAEYAARKGN